MHETFVGRLHSDPPPSTTTTTVLTSYYNVKDWGEARRSYRKDRKDFAFVFTDYQVTGKVPEMRSFSFSSVNKHRPHFLFSLLPARSCTQVVCNSHIPSCFWRVSEALRHWGLPVTFFFVFELLFLCSVLFRGSLLPLFYVTREFNTEDELDIACVCGTLQFYNLQVVAWFWSFMFWFSSSADYLRLDHTGRQYTDVIKLYHIFIILYSPLILV